VFVDLASECVQQSGWHLRPDNPRGWRGWRFARLASGWRGCERLAWRGFASGWRGVAWLARGFVRERLAWLARGWRGWQCGNVSEDPASGWQ
jgi:hypothetical protein